MVHSVGIDVEEGIPLGDQVRFNYQTAAALFIVIYKQTPLG